MPLPEINRQKILAVLSFVFSLPAGYYFLAGDARSAIVFVILSDFADGAGARLEKRTGKEGWKPFIKMAINRCADAAIFIGFALSGLVPKGWGIALLVAAIIVPFWVQTLWKRNVRWVFHAVVYLQILLGYTPYEAKIWVSSSEP